MRQVREVSAVLSKAGIPVGYKYRQTGYEKRGFKVTEPGCEVTRTRKGRYGGKEDIGHVAVYCIDPTKLDSSASHEFVERCAEALRKAGLIINVRQMAARIEVED